MSNNIDYESYIKGLGDVPTNQETVITNYLEEQCKKDDALKAAYNFIKEAVSKLQHTGNFIAVEDAVVFKMARDYFIEILPATIDVAPVQESVKEMAEQVEEDATSDNVKRSECGFEIYGEEVDEPEEAVEEEPCDQDEVGEEEKVLQPVASGTLKYDDEGNGLLFDL